MIQDYKALNYIQPNNRGWNSAQSIGRIYSNTGGTALTQRVFLRGGDWHNGADAGAFALYLHWAPSNTSYTVGFRCAR